MALGINANVLAGLPNSNGGLWVHPDGVIPADQLPTVSDIADLSAAGFVPVGFLSDAGITESTAIDTEKVKSWGGTTIKVLQNDYSKTYSFTLMEAANPETLKLVYGNDNVTVAADGTIQIRDTKEQRPHLTWAISVADGEVLDLAVIGDGQITERGDLQRVHSAVISHEVTLEAFEDSSGAFAHEYIVTPASGGDDNDDTDPENP